MSAGPYRMLLAAVSCTALLAACADRHDNDEPILELESDTRCDLAPGCVATAEDFSGNFLIGPDAQALRPFAVRVQVPDNIRVTAVSAEFAMPDMNMGVNRYRLIDEGRGLWRADVTLPVCMSGRSDWVAAFELLAQGRKIRFDTAFAVGK